MLKNILRKKGLKILFKINMNLNLRYCLRVLIISLNEFEYNLSEDFKDENKLVLKVSFKGQLSKF